MTRKAHFVIWVIVFLGWGAILSACAAATAEPPTLAPTPTRPLTAPRNENVEALNAAQAALEKIDFGFAPLLLTDEARVIIEAGAGVETARLTYPQQPADPTQWPTMDSFVSAYAARHVLEQMAHVSRVALGVIAVSASIDQQAEHVDHIAAWVTFTDRSRAIIDMTPLSTNFAPRHAPDQMITDINQIEQTFTDRRMGVNLDKLQPMRVVEEDGQLYYLLAKVLISYNRYEFYLRTHPVQPADPMRPMDIRPGASVGVAIDRDEFEALQKLLRAAGPEAFADNPDLLTHAGSSAQELTAVQNDHLHLLWHLITKFEHRPPDPKIPTATPTITPTPSPTPTPTPTATPKKLPLVTS
jgi:hypothetical protein